MYTTYYGVRQDGYGYEGRERLTITAGTTSVTADSTTVTADSRI